MTDDLFDRLEHVTARWAAATGSDGMMREPDGLRRLALMLAYEHGGSVDLGACRGCVSRSPKRARTLTTHRWRVTHAKPSQVRDGRRSKWVRVEWKGHTFTHVRAEPCRWCRGLGRKVRPLWMVLVDGGETQALLVAADALLAAGDWMGELIALALGPWAQGRDDDAERFIGMLDAFAAAQEAGPDALLKSRNSPASGQLTRATGTPPCN